MLCDDLHVGGAPLLRLSSLFSRPLLASSSLSSSPVIPASYNPRAIEREEEEGALVALTGYFSVAPQIAPFSIGDEPANWGEAVSAVCTIVKGDLPIELAWALNGEPISANDRPDITISSTGKRVSLMTIEAVSGSHAGEYTCTASNAAGATSYSATLAVNGTENRTSLSAIAPYRIYIYRYEYRSLYLSIYLSVCLSIYLSPFTGTRPSRKRFLSPRLHRLFFKVVPSYLPSFSCLLAT